MSFQKYEAYKESGVEWLGEVPKHWEVSLLKRRYQVTLGKMLKSNQTSSNETEEFYLRAANIHWRGVDTTDVKRMWFTPEEKNKLKLCKGDLLVSEGGDVGRSALWNDEIEGCYIQNSINRIRAREDADTRFLFYWMYFIKYADYIDMICNKATIAHFTVEKVEATPCVYPPLEEQKQIAAFLDKETAKIDTLIDKQEQLITLLQEKRQAIISHAVTRGLNPNVKMKDSGIEWLGEVPAHWEVKKLKHIVTKPLMYGANEAAIDDDRDQPRFVRITDIRNNGTLREDTFRSLPWHLAKPYMLREGDVLLARSGATVGKSFIYSSDWDECCFAGYLIKASIDISKASPYWFYRYTESDYYWNWISSTLIQATIQNVSAEKYNNFSLCIPPKQEQKQIAAFLDSETTKIDTLIEKCETAIELLKERRTALISAAVTGKIDVRDAV